MLQPGTLFSWRLWRHQNRLTLMISVFPNHLDCSEMLFWRIGLRKSWMNFAIIILIGSHKIHNWARRLLVWGSRCRFLVAILKVWKLVRKSKKQIKLPLSWLAITIRYRWRRFNTCSKRIHVSNGRCEHFCHQHSVPRNQWQRELWWVQKESLNESFLCGGGGNSWHDGAPIVSILEVIIEDMYFCVCTK